MACLKLTGHICPMPLLACTNGSLKEVVRVMLACAVIGSCASISNEVHGVDCYNAGLEVGQPVATLSGGCFAEYVVMPAKFCLPAGTMQKEVVALLTSGLTASIGALLSSCPGTSQCPCLA